MTLQLNAKGAQILDQTGNAREGFKFQYKLGKTLGDVNVEPLEIPSATALTSRLSRKDEVAVHSKLTVSEKMVQERTRAGCAEIERETIVKRSSLAGGEADGYFRRPVNSLSPGTPPDTLFLSPGISLPPSNSISTSRILLWPSGISRPLLAATHGGRPAYPGP
jgi:hypothetical protein